MVDVRLLAFSFICLAVLLGANHSNIFAIEYTNSEVTLNASSTSTSTNETEMVEVAKYDERPIVQHTPLPDQVKAIYMTSCVAGTPNFRQRLVDLINETEINKVL